jgi:ATP-dependent Clp protease ATP-binding subunit ClpA
MEKFAASRLVGAPPGYVGYEEGGQLTEKVRKRPYSVILFDEIEKAHPDLINILLQIMDNATLTDNNGYKANFQNVILIMTSNIGTNMRSTMGFNKDNNITQNEELKSFFSPEFRNRLDAIINFNPLNPTTLKGIIAKFIATLNQDLLKKKIVVKMSDEAIDFIVKSEYSIEMGARPLKRYITNNITNKLSDEILFGSLKNGGKVYVDINENKLQLHYSNS